MVSLAALAGCSRAPSETTAHEGASAPSRVPACVTVASPGADLRSVEKREAARVAAASKRVRRGPRPLELWDTPYGAFWVVAGDFETLAWVLAEQEANIYGDGTAGVHRGDTVLDCGAHFGGYTRKALAMGARRVVAIELAPENVQCLRRTFASEIAGGRVIVYPKGVWDKDAELTLARGDHTWADGATEGPAQNGPTVPLTTIDKIVSELGLTRVDFIKMDIEGAEEKALSGAAATLRTFRPRMALAAYHNGAKDLVALPASARRSQPAYDVCLWGGSAGWGNQTLLFR